MTIWSSILSRNFCDWFAVGEGDKLLVSTFLPLPIAWTTPSALLVLGQTISFFGMSFNNKRTGKTMTEIFEPAENQDHAQFRIEIISWSTPKIKACKRSKIVLATKIKMFIFQQFRDNSLTIFLVMMCAKTFFYVFCVWVKRASKKIKQH